MALPADYTSGTITLTNGSPNFTGTGTGWLAADFREGDILLGIQDHAGQVYVVQEITSQTSGVLTQDWAGASGTYEYRMRYEWDSSRVSAQTRTLIELLGNGNLQALANLTGAPDQVPVFTGPGAMELVPREDFGSGDFVGPNGGVADGDLVAFSGTTGKVGRKAEPSAVTALLNAFVGDSGAGGTKGLVPSPAAGDGAAGRLLSASGTWVLPASAPNLLMNSDFAVNQRGFTSGGATSQTRSFDRWLLWSGGQTVTFNSAVNRTITIGADPIWFYQIVPGSRIEGGNYVLTWSGTATAQVLIGGSWTGVTRGVSFSLPAGQNTGVRFQGGTLAVPKLEKGDRATPWEKPNYEASLEACKAYYQVARAFILFTAAAANNYVYVSVFLGATMRATPTVSTSIISPETNMSTPIVDEISTTGCRIYGQATAAGSVGMWRNVIFDAELTG